MSAESNPVQIFLVNQLTSIVRDTALATELPEAAVLRAVSEIIRAESHEPPTAARVFVNRVARARRAGERFVLFGQGDSMLCLKCFALIQRPTGAANQYCAKCRVYLRDVIDPDDGRAA